MRDRRPEPRNRWPPSRHDPLIDAIPESSWVTVTPQLLALMLAEARAAREAQAERRLRRSPH
jgi:hypothetical protein